MKTIRIAIFVLISSSFAFTQNLYWSQFKGPQLQKLEKGTTNIDTLINEPTPNSSGFFIEYDTTNHWLFHASSFKISRTDTCMDNFSEIYETTGFVSITDMKLDANNGLIYFVLKDNGGLATVYKIMRCDINGGGLTQIHQRPDDHEISAFCLDITGGHIYFNNFDNSDSEQPEGPMIKRITTSGFGLLDFTCGDFLLDMHFDEVNDDLYLSYGDILTRVDNANICDESIILDFNSQNIGINRFKVDATYNKIIWTEGTRLRSSAIDGSNISTLYDSCSFRDVAPNADYSMIYWTNLNAEMGSVKCDGSDFQKKWVDAITTSDVVRVDTKNNKMYMVNLFRLLKMDLDAKNVEVLAEGISNGMMDIDVRDQKVYFVRRISNENHIMTINMDGTGEEVFYNLGSGNSPTSLTIDSENCLLYWIDFFSKKVFKIGLNGCDMAEVVHTGGTSFNIDIHSGIGKIYWLFADSLCRSNLDGTNRECLVRTYGTFTITQDKVYWGDRIADALFCSDLDGQNVQNILSLSGFDFVRSITCGDTMAMSQCFNTIEIGKISMDSSLLGFTKIIADSCITANAKVTLSATQCVDLESSFSVDAGCELEIDVGCP